ncbi:hypothetical protein F5Y12DRAFT_716793 [Xylaria sp. FL1777]|nr:hypothetical protein F5Y12DRAFT_716793 [Xylaria sp. FL1777]
MPSAQQHLPPETSKGTGTSVFRFSINPFSEFLVKAGRPLFTRLVSAIPIPLGRPGDMNKPGNLGAPQPINTLSNNSASSRTPFGIQPSSRPIISSPPPAKRQKLNESNTHPGHCRATFAVIDRPTSRKQSIGSESVADSQRSVASNMSASPSMVTEYRLVDKHTKPKRFRKNRDNPEFLGQEGIDSPPLRSLPPLKSDEDISEDEVDLINPSKELVGSHQLKRKQPEERPISDFASRFQRGGTPAHPSPSQTFGKLLDKVDERTKHQKSDLSPDELAPSVEELAASQPAKRLKTSASLSKRGNITPTKFYSASTARSSSTTSAKLQQADDHKRNAEMIIGNGLRIVRGASGQCQYQTEDKDDPNYCALSIREIGHTLLPVDQEKEILKQYRYLTLDIMKVKSIIRSRDDEECCIVNVISDSPNLSNGAGPRLMIEFASTLELSKFLQWVALYRGSSYPITIKDGHRAKLEKDFDEMMQRAKRHKLLSDSEIEASVPDDVRVISHNRNRSSLGYPSVATDPKSQPKLRDAMKYAPTSTSNSQGIASNQAWDDQLVLVQPQTRTTRSMFAYKESLEPSEPEPIPEGWTSLHAGWEKQWRNSLVYPSTGKNRATIDKEDIQRLDEGQFLNDNIIIFYLRYLQKTLEEENKDLAKRIYFQNTFFYDKLKPTKNGQGINYDSVKTWTSKVDLFSKDYIIVPINEYTHWYVAIICNAPKLIPASNNHEQNDDIKREAITITDSVEVTQESPQAPSRNEIPNGGLDGEHVAHSAQEDVIEHLRRMSIDSPDNPSIVTKHKADNNAEKGVNSIAAKDDYEVYEIKDSDRLEAELEYITTAAHAQTRKKTGKRQSIGSRRHDPNQPRIITLDSLGVTHSPTCSYLKQYLVAELKDKRGIEIPSPGAMGTTARDIPEQTNHCDCGLFLLGYIQEFLCKPDNFVRSILQRDGGISWKLDPSELRNNIRDVIFKLQREQQTAEDAAQERKRQAKMSKQQTRVAGALSPTATSAMMLPNISPKTELASPKFRGDEGGQSETPLALSHTRSSSSRTSAEAMDPTHLPDFGRNSKHAATSVQPSAPRVQNDDTRATQQSEMRCGSNLEETQTKSKASPQLAASPRRTQPTFDHEIHHQVPSTSPLSPVSNQAAKRYSTSPGTEGSANPQNNFLAPLASETPSSKDSRGATPLDPVFVDDSDNNRRDRAWKNPQRHQGGRTGHLVVEIPSANNHIQSPGKDEKTDGRKQTEQQSHYFLNRQDGERVISAKLHEKTQNDVIDLSGD